MIVLYTGARPFQCKFCEKGVGMMFHHFAASHNMMEEEQYIIKEACSKESDPNECTMLVKQYWPKVAMKLFTRPNAKMVCGGLDPSCSSKTFQGSSSSLSSASLHALSLFSPLCILTWLIAFWTVSCNFCHYP